MASPKIELEKTNSQLDVLNTHIDEEIANSDHRREKNRNWAKRLQLTSIIATAAIPVLLGMQIPSQTAKGVLANVALIMGALATGVNAYEAFYGYKELWAANTATFTELHRLKVEVERIVANPPGDASKIDELYKKFHAIMEEADSAWFAVRKNMAKQRTPPNKE